MQQRRIPPAAVSRRQMLARCAGALMGLAALSVPAPLRAATAARRRFKVGACDWSLGKLGDPTAFDLAKEIGLDGVQVSLGTVADDLKLRRPEVQREYRDAARRTGLEIASLAIGELNHVPFKSDPRAVEWASDAIDVCRALGVRVVLLAFFNKGDLRDDSAGVEEVVRRLRRLAPRAEKAGVVLGIESWLSAGAHLDILRRVGSRAVQVYYDCCNAHERGYDVELEIRALGRKRICEFHFKENGALLGQGRVDYRKVRAALDAIGYRGWVQIEGALPPGADLLESYRANCRYVRQVLA
jgi:sugar phosphate isomerase/epimerase